jgi:hypothetical protein
MPIALILGALVAGAVVAGLRALWLRRQDPDAAPTSVVLKSAALIPLGVALLLALLSLWALATSSGKTGELNPWLTVYVTALLGTYVAVPAFVGGLIAALLMVWRKSQ